MEQNSVENKKLHYYNQIIQKCLKLLKERYDNIIQIINNDDRERIKLQNEIEQMTCKLSEVNKAISQSIVIKENYEHSIQDIEKCYKKIIEMSAELSASAELAANTLCNEIRVHDDVLMTAATAAIQQQSIDVDQLQQQQQQSKLLNNDDIMKQRKAFTTGSTTTELNNIKNKSMNIICSNYSSNNSTNSNQIVQQIVDDIVQPLTQNHSFGIQNPSSNMQNKVNKVHNSRLRIQSKSGISILPLRTISRTNSKQLLKRKETIPCGTFTFDTIYK